MKKYFLGLIAGAMMLASCGTTSTVPITGRKQNLLVSDEQVLSLSNEQYASYMKTAKASTNATNTAMVKRVGQKLATAVETYLKNNGYASELKQYSWTFNLVQDNSVNAFCMPGGKIVVYEGLLPVTKNEASLAIVLGHEIAHAVAKHSAERMSQSLKQQYGAQILSGVLSGAGASSSLQSLGNAAYGIGAQLGGASYSRKQESEADHLGLIFAAMAGYDPSVAVSFWQRMSQASGSTSYTLLSSHPSDATRIKDIQKWLPEAKTYYKGDSSFPYATSTKSSSTSKKKTSSLSKSKTTKTSKGK